MAGQRSGAGLMDDGYLLHLAGCRMQCPRVSVSCLYKTYQTKIVCNDPFEWLQVDCSLETGHGSHVTFLAEEAHTDVVP